MWSPIPLVFGLCVVVAVACAPAGSETLDGASSPDGAQVGDGGNQSDDAAAGQDAAVQRDATTAADAATSAECEAWEIQHPTWLWCDGFDVEQDLHASYPDVGSNGFAVSDQDAFEGSYSIQQHYDLGQVSAGWIFFFYADALGQDYGNTHDDIYVRWYHKFEPGFDGFPPKMARISSIGPGWDKRFAVHHWIGDDGTIVADVHVPHSSQANSAGWLPVARSSFSFSEPANVGRWVCHEMQVRTNTPGQSDGAYRFWADGELVVERTEVDLRGATDYNFNAVQLDTYWNGGSPADQSRYYDNFVVSAQRIGCR